LAGGASGRSRGTGECIVFIDSLPLGAETRTVYGRDERPAL